MLCVHPSWSACFGKGVGAEFNLDRKKSSLKSENAIFLPSSTTNRGIGITQYGLSSLGCPILSPFMMHKVQNLPNQCPQDKAESGYSIAWGPAN